MQNTVRITEIYKSIQGESSFTGLPCIFVRLTGCNLRCVWCDSEYTFSGGENMALDGVMKRVRSLGPVKLVEITGGEPMLQEREVIELMHYWLKPWLCFLSVRRVHSILLSLFQGVDR